MRTRIPTLIVCLCVLASLAIAESRAVIISQPSRAVIYRDGYCFLEETLVLGAGNGAAVRLSPNTDVASLSAFLGKARVDNLAVKEEVVSVETEKGTEKKRTGYLVSLPDALQGARKNQSVVLRYGVTGITWQPRLEVSVVDDGQVAISLRSLIGNGSQDLRSCQVLLASAAGPLQGKLYYEEGARGRTRAGTLRGADVCYDLGRRTIPGSTTAVTTIQSATAQFRMKHIWDTRTRERVRSVIVTKNPFDVPLCPASFAVLKNNVIVANGESEWASPGQTILLPAGTEPRIGVERSIVTTENLDKKARRFTHTIKLRVANATGRGVVVEALFGKKLGRHHRTEYRFKREPDRRPGDLLLWELKLGKDEAQTIEFAFDSDQAKYHEYEHYESADYSY